MEGRQRSRGWGGWVVALLALLAIPLLLACGIILYVAIVTHGSPFTWFSPPPPYPQIIGKNCGTITAGARGPAGDFAASEQCLWHAYQTCQTATLVYTITGLDTTDSHAVSVQPHGASCAVTDAMQGVIEGINRTTRTSYPCTGMEQQARGLVILGCGAEGDLTISASLGYRH